jgi:hypothetical protein
VQVYWLENKPQCNSWGFSFLFKQENILNMESNDKYKDELIIEMRALSRLGELIPTLEVIGHSKELLYSMIDSHINLVKDAFQNYKNPPKYGIKGKLKIKTD